MISNSYEQSVNSLSILNKLLFTEKSQIPTFLDKIVDDIEEFRCDCKISESCNICETKRWLQMLQQYNGILSSQQLPTFPEENFNIPLYLSKVYEIIHAVLNFKSATIKNVNNYEDEFFKIKSDNESLKIKTQRLQDEIDSKIKQIGKLENQISMSSKSNKSNQDKMGLEKEELNSKIIKMQTKVQVMQNEFKKKELEFLKMKDQLRSKDRIIYANRYDITPLKSTSQPLQQGNLDMWISTRKGLIDEVCLLQDTLHCMISILNQFFIQVTQKSEKINPDIVKMPLQCGKCIQWLKQQLLKIHEPFIIDESFIQDVSPLTNSFTISEQQQPQKQQNQHYSHNKNNSINGSVKKDSFKILNRSQTLHFQQSQIPDDTMSILSRISINDMMLQESTNSAKFVKEEQPKEKMQLKKWEFVFKDKQQ